MSAFAKAHTFSVDGVVHPLSPTCVFPSSPSGHPSCAKATFTSVALGQVLHLLCKMREMFAHTPLWQQIVTNADDRGLKSIFELANVHADIIQEITAGEGIMTLREFVSSWEAKSYEHRLIRWIDRNVLSCKGRRVEGSRFKLAWKAGVSIAYRTTTISPGMQALLAPKRKIGKTNYLRVKKR